jgi:hypothetical protein
MDRYLLLYNRIIFLTVSNLRMLIFYECVTLCLERLLTIDTCNVHVAAIVYIYHRTGFKHVYIFFLLTYIVIF